MARKKNVYMGQGRSTAGIPVNGKVDEPWEIMANLYAMCYDVFLDKDLLTRNPYHDIPAKIRTLNGRFGIIRLLAIRNGHQQLVPIINQAQQLTIAYLHGAIERNRYIQMIRQLVSPYLSQAKIKEIERLIKKVDKKR